jgi:hypothetical protein
MAEKWHVGNANIDGESTRGWLLGHFIGEADDPRASRAVEVKWGVHPAGEGRDGWATDEQRTTLLILVRAAPSGPVGGVDHAGEGRRLRRLGSRN